MIEYPLLERSNFHAVGVYSIEVPPVPIPNTVVKLNCAEDTWRAAARENRSSPTQKSVSETDTLFFFVLFRPVQERPSLAAINATSSVHTACTTAETVWVLNLDRSSSLALI